MSEANPLQMVFHALVSSLRDVSVDAEREITILLSQALQKPSWYIKAYPDALVSPTVEILLKQQIKLRQQGYPLAYILQEQAFWKHRFQVGEGVLIPRPETEVLLEQALLCMRAIPQGSPEPILELGTGSGALILSLAAERPDLEYLALDKSEVALRIAQQNAKNFPDCQVEFIHSDWFSNPLIKQRAPFALILSNPPYIPAQDPHLQDLKHEPLLALSPGKTGLEAFIIIAEQAKMYLKPGGYLLFEHGYDQQTDLKKLLWKQGFQSVEGYADLSGQDRVIVARYGSML